MPSVDYPRNPLAEDDRKHLGSLTVLPPEVRVLIYKRLLVSHAPWLHTYGKGSSIATEILSVCRTIYLEAIDILYNTCHQLTVSTVSRRPGIIPQVNPPVPPLYAIARMRNITLSVHYETNNRGECEEFIRWNDRLLAFTEPIALALLRSKTITSVTIILLNETQRKVGVGRFRLPKVAEQMRSILLPFAYLPTQAQVAIEGFQTNETAHQFARMREAGMGKDPPITELLDNALGDEHRQPQFAEGRPYY